MFHRILVPVDFSDGALHALRLAIELARESGGHITLFHCAGTPNVLDTGPGGGLYYAELIQRIAKEVEHELIRLALEEIPQGLSHDHVQVSGFPPAEIVAYATKGKYDVIVMGTHGRTGLNHVFMGSVAARVIQRAEVPVLVCR